MSPCHHVIPFFGRKRRRPGGVHQSCATLSGGQWALLESFSYRIYFEGRYPSAAAALNGCLQWLNMFKDVEPLDVFVFWLRKPEI